MAKKKLLPQEIQKQIDEAVKKCYTCSKCTSGCPVAPEMDFPPSLLVKWLALGDIEKILKSRMIWVCSSCQNCYSRCPFEINIPHIIDLMKEYSNKDKLARKERATRLFHKVFLANIKNLGRIHEAGLIGLWKAVSGKWFSDLGLGIKMFSSGKLKILPEKIKNQKEIRNFFKAKHTSHESRTTGHGKR